MRRPRPSSARAAPSCTDPSRCRAAPGSSSPAIPRAGFSARAARADALVPTVAFAFLDGEAGLLAVEPFQSGGGAVRRPQGEVGAVAGEADGGALGHAFELAVVVEVPLHLERIS